MWKLDTFPHIPLTNFDPHLPSQMAVCHINYTAICGGPGFVVIEMEYSRTTVPLNVGNTILI